MHAEWAVACAVWLHILTAVGSAVHGEAAKREKKLTFYANKSVDGLQLSKYLADFKKWGTILIITSCLTLSMPYFTSGGHFSDLLRCSKVRQLKVAIVTLRSNQQGVIRVWVSRTESSRLTMHPLAALQIKYHYSNFLLLLVSGCWILIPTHIRT